MILGGVRKSAAIAQSVECVLGKDEVTSSILVSSSSRLSGKYVYLLVGYTFFL